jgi:hypothetical protein
MEEAWPGLHSIFLSFFLAFTINTIWHHIKREKRNVMMPVVDG